jgi:two-component system chemotaxis response regulator CheB
MGSDGAKGLLSMKNAGARTIGQDEASCIVYGMPKIAYDIGAVERQVPLNKVANTILSLI